MSAHDRSRMGILGTLSDFHQQPIAYDLACLKRLVADLAPDLLCAEITREAWESGDLSGAGVEVRDALAPVVAATDIVLVPIAPSPEQFADFNLLPGGRRALASKLNRLLQWGQRLANRPEVIQGVMFKTFCHTVCSLTEMSWNANARKAWEAQNKALAANILQAIHRDIGSRALTVVQCQRVHKLVPLLKRHADVFELVAYQEL